MNTPMDLFGIECGYGWYGLIYPVINMIKEYNKNVPKNDTIQITQIKEKWGGLRFYVSHAPEYIYNEIERIEEESYYICEETGSPINVGTTQGGWIRTICKKQAEKENILWNWEKYCTSNIMFVHKYNNFIDNLRYKIFFKIKYNLIKLYGKFTKILER